MRATQAGLRFEGSCADRRRRRRQLRWSAEFQGWNAYPYSVRKNRKSRAGLKSAWVRAEDTRGFDDR